MHETSKTLARHGDRLAPYLVGRGIDIGCKWDQVTPDCRRFDLEHGDAQRIDEYVDEEFDFVYSSHCLEHLADPVDALRRWWGLVRPGGHLILVVPDEDLYEQGFWPSQFNRDHRATFRVSGPSAWSPVSVDLTAAFAGLDECRVEVIEVQDDGIDHRLVASGPMSVGRVRSSAWAVVAAVLRLVGAPIAWRLLVSRRRGAIVDQTKVADQRLAQIMVVATRSDATGVA